jgi:transposase
LLPRDFPPWKTIYDWFRRWRIDGTRERLNAALRELLRVRLGRDPRPSAAVVDSQSVKSTGVGGNERGFDPAKKVEGRKRHILVDTEGLVLQARVHSARVPDADGIRLLLEQVQGRFGRLSHPWVDAGYQGRGKHWAEEVLGLSVEVVRKPKKPVPEKVAERRAAEWAKEGKEVDWQNLMPPQAAYAAPPNHKVWGFWINMPKSECPPTRRVSLRVTGLRKIQHGDVRIGVPNVRSQYCRTNPIDRNYPNFFSSLTSHSLRPASCSISASWCSHQSRS